jgi:hypothetical protein
MPSGLAVRSRTMLTVEYEAARSQWIDFIVTNKHQMPPQSSSWLR